MSEIQANKLSPASGTALTLGDSGDTLTLTAGANLTLGGSSTTVTIPSGATITNSGTATGFGEDNAPYFFATGNGSQSISYATMTTVEYNTESLDSDNGFNTSTYKYTIPSGKGGLWFFSASMYMQTINSGHQADLYIYKDSTNLAAYRDKFNGNINPFMNIHCVGNFSAGDNVFVQVYHNQSGSINITTNSNAARFAGFRIKEL